MRRLMDRAIDGALAVILVAMTLVVFLQVFFRYVLNHPLSWPEETARILIVWLAFVGGYMAMREHKHIGFGLLVEKLPPRWQGLVGLVGQLLVVLFLVVIVKEGVAFARNNLDIPMPYTEVSTGWVVYSVFPLSGILMLFQSVLDVLAAAGQLRGGGRTAGTGRR